MVKTISYTCVSCLGESDVKIKYHLDKGTYIECDCGERCEPTDSDEIKKLITQE